VIDDKSEPGAWAAALQARADTANKPTTTDHAEAAAVMLEKVAAQLRAGRPPEDLGETVVLIGRMMARKT
jgi:hypothetical protein